MSLAGCSSGFSEKTLDGFHRHAVVRKKWDPRQAASRFLIRQ
jgi:hypothetical protein